MKKKDIIALHLKNEAYPAFAANEFIHGGVLSLPKNVIKEYPEKTYIYEFDKDTLSVFKDKKKVQSVKIERSLDYITRLLIIFDITARAANQGYKIDLTQVKNHNGKKVKKQAFDSLYSVLTPPNASELKEEELFKYLKLVAEDNPSENVPKDIQDGYHFILKHYLEVRKND